MTIEQKEKIIKLCEEYELVDIQEHKEYKIIYLKDPKVDNTKAIKE